MQLLKLFTYEDRDEYVAVSQVQSIRLPSGRVHDGGAVQLVTGRIIALSDRSSGQAERLVKQLAELPE